ncbi:ABC transporter ATP-binding protein [Clostridium beijerinckii]|uniref:ABC transporter ATP-binding protein n=1 Tax=Clostridium beijerinckii TaxID=1520 RepID=UPI00098C3A3A|nr:ABC transporter ATP-binding protein [Clostridium beijerinckii]MBA8934698.1 oligopeptide transport system ATP-binding protein [Clostridium beijerinckii]NRT35197.1 oligopeptide transport system ATP-binding protein [Clostridium beijerinckii]NRT45373.1 oligopeptide transport system ATP-binding protein [Clostridium beijerinckii]NRT71900.1 oligopeptide transport system ATP-binding protein [Clostridium beijerinckii]NRU39098.1 oligopeptide transport system ATP-binding protein [Clostridium beijerinc
MSKEALLKIKDLKTNFYIKNNKIEAVRGVNFEIKSGEILGIVGESGSGKSVLMKSVMRILPPNAQIDSGEVYFNDNNILKLSAKDMRKIKGKEIAMIFQDPMTALNPLKKIGDHIIEVLVRHKRINKRDARKVAIDVLKDVGIPMPEKRIDQYPHEFSGGMRQRVLIAMALACNPKLLIADEPTTALDVTIQAQILELLKSLKTKNNMSIILITHDLGVVASLCNRIAVMYGGLIMEEGTTEEIFYSSKHPYTKALLNSIPKVQDDEKARLNPIKGSAPSLLNPPTGCPFAERCEFAKSECFNKIPEYSSFSKTHRSMCLLAK